MEEVAGQHGGRLGGEEPPPGGVVAAHGRRWDAEPFEDPPDAGRLCETERKAPMNALEVLSSQPGVERLGWTLIHFIWQGGAIAVLYGVVRSTLTRRSSASVR